MNANEISSSLISLTREKNNNSFNSLLNPPNVKVRFLIPKKSLINNLES